MKILEEGSIPEDRLAGMQHVGKSFRCPTCSTVVQIEAKDIEMCKKHEHACMYDYERYIPCITCGDTITFTTDELIHENVNPPTWEEVRSQMNRVIKKNYTPIGSIEREYQMAVESGDEEAQERILKQVWEEKNQP